MRLVTYETDGRCSFGVVRGDGVIDLRRLVPEVDDLSALLASPRWAELDQEVEGATADVALAEVTVLRPIERPGKIFCIGVNYGGRNAEYRDGEEERGFPSVFLRVPESLTGPDHPLIRPPESEQLDYEGEIVAVVGRAGRRIAETDARAHLAGLMLGNEGTVRDWVRHAKFNVTQGKNWERSGAIGPWLVTMDEIPPFDDLDLTTRVNGEVRQHDTPASMRFSIEFQVSYLSTFVTLQPGDLIFTGTPTGAGARFEPPRYLVPGDVIEVEVQELGTLRNTVADE